MSTSFLYLLVILSIARAAAPEKKEFSISSFFEGSWIIASRQLNLETGDIVNDVSFIQYNITKTDENEYDIWKLNGVEFVEFCRELMEIRIPFRMDIMKRLYNGSNEYGGIGKLRLVSNTEGTATDKFLYRRMIFETVDINDSFCSNW